MDGGQQVNRIMVEDENYGAAITDCESVAPMPCSILRGRAFFHSLNNWCTVSVRGAREGSE